MYYVYRAARRLKFSELYNTKYGETTRLSFAQIKHTANEITNSDEADRTPLVDVVACAGGDWSVVRWRAGAGVSDFGGLRVDVGVGLAEIRAP